MTNEIKTIKELCIAFGAGKEVEYRCPDGGLWTEVNSCNIRTVIVRFDYYTFRFKLEPEPEPYPLKHIKALEEALEREKELREGDNQLILNLAESAGIKITVNTNMLGLVWGQFSRGVLEMKERLDSIKNKINEH